MPASSDEADKINASIAALESQRDALGNAVVNSAIEALQRRLSQLGVIEEERLAEDERKVVTVVFADVSGFTALSEKKDPEEVRALMNACFESLVPIVQKYEGTIDKFIGDEIMALFGAPVAHEDDPERALRTALEMMNAIAVVNRVHGTELGLHIGINTGPVIAGQIGAQSRRDYSVMGDAVNLAARLEDASSSGEIFVGPNTYRRTAGLFEFEKIPPLDLKGKEAPVEVHRLIGSKAGSKSRREREGLHSALLGRDSEMRQLYSALELLANGVGSICIIMGEAGMGKSRLVSEARTTPHRDVEWAEGRALSYTAGMSYWLARSVLCGMLEVDADAPQSEIDAALKAAIERELDREFADVYPYLARLLELPLDNAMAERVTFLSSEALQGRILRAFQDYVRARAKRRPLALVWEDVHWCDPSSWQVFENLWLLTPEVPLLLLCLARPDENFDPKMLRRAAEVCPTNFQRIEVSPLTRTQSAALFGQFVQLTSLPEKMRDLIIDRADGNPFFLEELIRSLLDSGVLVREGDRTIAIREINAVDIPDTLQSTLMTRIDRLQAQAKSTLQRASVIGRVFQQHVLKRIYQHQGAVVDFLANSLSELQHREFIRSQDESTVVASDKEYIFNHAITHDVAYGSMLLARRKELHKLVGEAIEQLFPDRLEELSATLGYHFERAEAHERAAHYLGCAAERAQATFANSEATTFYQSAIDQLERTVGAKDNVAIQQRAARLYEGLGDVLTLMGKQTEARSNYDRARPYVPDYDSVWRSRLYRKTGFSHNLQRHYNETALAYDAADKELGDAIDARPAEWWEEKVQIQLERMHLFYWQGMVTEMRELAESIRSVVEERGTSLQRGKFFEKLALSHLSDSRYRPTEECVDLAKLAVSQTQDSANLSETAHIRFVLGFVHLWRGNFADAIEQLGKSEHLAERCGNLVAETRCLTYLTVAHRATDKLEETRVCAMQALDLATRLEMIEYKAMARANLAWASWREQNYSEAELLGREALELWHGMDDPYGFDWMALWPLIAVAVERNEINCAVNLADGLFLKNQHPLHEKVMSATRDAIDTCRSGNATAGLSQMKVALETAKRHSYL